MREARDCLGSSKRRAPSWWRGACIPDTSSKTSRAGNSALGQKQQESGDHMKNCIALLVPIAAVLLTTAGCTMKTAAANPESAPEVQVATVEQRDVTIYHEWIGTLDGMVNAAIRAEVTGYLLSQNYAEGSFVRKGQLLFEVDPRPFQAALDQAQGQLAQARAQLAQSKAQLAQAQAQLAQSVADQGRTQLDVDKYTPLASQQAITQQEMDNAVQNNVV